MNNLLNEVRDDYHVFLSPPVDQEVTSNYNYQNDSRTNLLQIVWKCIDYSCEIKFLYRDPLMESSIRDLFDMPVHYVWSSGQQGWIYTNYSFINHPKIVKIAQLLLCSHNDQTSNIAPLPRDVVNVIAIALSTQ